jgi:hypothetical protein
MVWALLRPCYRTIYESRYHIVHSLYKPQTLNRYTYVENNPLRYIDEDGHFAWFIPVIAAVVGSAINTGIYVWQHHDSGLTAGGLDEVVVSGTVAGAISVILSNSI